MDFPRQRPEPNPRSAGALKALRYTAASAWILALGISANAAMFWFVDWLLSR